MSKGQKSERSYQRGQRFLVMSPGVEQWVELGEGSG